MTQEGYIECTEYFASQLIRYSRACGYYQDFLDRVLLMIRKLLNQGFLLVKLKLSLRTFSCRHHDLVNCYRITMSQMTSDMFHFTVLTSFMTYHWVCNQSIKTSATTGTGTAHHSTAPEFTPGFYWGSCCSIFSFLCSVLQILICPFGFFLLTIVLSVLR